jgi:hypothetical protein
MEQQDGPNYGKLILIPSLITLAITLLRLGSEFMNLPSWLANKNPGGFGALIGISWLPPIFGIYFANKLIRSPGKPWRKLFNTLFLYGLAARIPVIVIMGLAIYGNWGTHYDSFPPGSFSGATSLAKFLRGAVMIQLIWWALIWTVGAGMLTGLPTALIRSRRSVKPQ